jgi:hypothetical protein
MSFLDFLDVLLSNFWTNFFIYILFLIAYIVLFRSRIWSILDPLFIQVVSMASASFCVYVLFYYNLVAVKFIYSFVLSEICFLIGFFIVKNKKKETSQLNDNNDISQLTLFVNIVGIIYIIAQFYTFKAIGFILFEKDQNHAFAFEEHGILRVFLNNSRVLFLIALYYRRHVVGSFRTIEKFAIAFTVFGSLMSGSKSALVLFFTIYIIVNYIYAARNKIKRIKFSPVIIVLLLISAVFAIYIKNNQNLSQSVSLLYLRFVGGGDIFVLGYHDAVMAAIKEKSGLKYIFYPGIGTIFKWFFGMEPPSIIGVDITEYYTGMRDSGPNARHNYLGFYFWGYYGCIFSFICGFIVSWVRYSLPYKIKRARFEIVIFICNIIYLCTDLITDANFFVNQMFWAVFMFLFVYFITELVHRFLFVSTAKLLSGA